MNDYLRSLRHRRREALLRGYSGSDLHAYVTLGYEPIQQTCELPELKELSTSGQFAMWFVQLSICGG